MHGPLGFSRFFYIIFKVLFLCLSNCLCCLFVWLGMYLQGGANVETRSASSRSAFDELTAPAAMPVIDIKDEVESEPDIDIKQEVDSEAEEMGSQEEMMAYIRSRSQPASQEQIRWTEQPKTPVDEDDVVDQGDEQAVADPYTEYPW